MLVGLLVFVAMTTNGPAQAQSVQSLDLPPQQSMKDQNDVNWLNAMYEPESRELSIGVEGADLTFVRHNSSGGRGYVRRGVGDFQREGLSASTGTSKAPIGPG